MAMAKSPINYNGLAAKAAGVKNYGNIPVANMNNVAQYVRGFTSSPSGSGSGSGSYAGALNSAADAIDVMTSIANANNAYSASQAEILRDWQEVQNAKAMTFNSSEAAKNRAWQEYMSNTAHQREVKDLQAAGLNPVLSAMNGNGAAVTSGATASGVTSAGAKGETDMSMNSALVSLLAAVYNRTTQIEAANINARTQEAVADKYNATSEIVARLSAAASKYGADASAYASKYASDRNDYRAMYELIGSLYNDASSSGALSSARDAWNSFNDRTVQLENKVKNWSDKTGLTYVLGEIKNLFKRK